MSHKFSDAHIANIKALRQLVKIDYTSYRFYSDSYIRTEAIEAIEFANSIKFEGDAESVQANIIIRLVKDWLDIYNDYCIKMDSYMSSEARAACHNDAILDAEVVRCFNVAQTAQAKIDEQFVVVLTSLGINEFCIDKSAEDYYKNALFHRANYKSRLANMKDAKKAAIKTVNAELPKKTTAIFYKSPY